MGVPALLPDRRRKGGRRDGVRDNKGGGGCFKTSVAFGVVNEYVHVRVCVGIFDYKIYRDLAARLKWIKRFESTLLQQSGYQACTAKTKLLFLHRKLWAHNEFEPLFASKHHASLPVTRHSVLLTRDQRSFRFRDSCAPWWRLLFWPLAITNISIHLFSKPPKYEWYKYSCLDQMCSWFHPTFYEHLMIFLVMICFWCIFLFFF